MEEKKTTLLAVLAIQCIYTGMFLLSKAAFDVGMNTYVFVFYRQAFATVFFVPIAFFIERKTAPPLSLMICIKIFILSLVGITLSLDIYNVGLQHTSASLAAATSNTIPVITFFLCITIKNGTSKIKGNFRHGKDCWIRFLPGRSSNHSLLQRALSEITGKSSFAQFQSCS